MSSDLAKTIHTIAKHLHAAEQRELAEQSAAVLCIRHEECPDEYNGYYSDWEIHKTVNGTVQLSQAIAEPTSRAPLTDGYKLHTYNQAVGEYLAGHFLCYEGEAPPGVILVGIHRRNKSPARAALQLRCTAETLPRSIHAIMQAYLAGSFL